MGYITSIHHASMSLLAKWILGVLLVISPPEKMAKNVPGETADEIQARFEHTATVMADVIDGRGALFKGADGKFKTAAILVGIMKFESELSRDVAVGTRRGDHGKSWCYMQIMVNGKHNIWGDDEMKTWTGQDLVEDWNKCFSVGYEIVKYSLRSCGSYKNGDILSGYTTGTCKNNEKKAQHRWNYAQWLLRTNPIPAEPEPVLFDFTVPAEPPAQTTFL